MILLATLSIILNTAVVYNGVMYFHYAGSCRESDKTLVAVATTISVMVLLAQAVGWVVRPAALFGNPALTLLYGFTMASTVVHLAMIRSLLHRVDHRIDCKEPQ